MIGDFALLELNCPSDFTEKQYYLDKNTIYLSDEFFVNKRKRIEITLFELSLLKVLAVQQVLSLEQIYNIYSTYQPIKYTTLQKKFNRWAKNGIVKAKRPWVDSVFGIHNIYSIDFKGVELLVDNRYLSKDWLDVDVSEYLKKINVVHTIGQQDVVVELMTNIKDNEDAFESVAPRRFFSSKEIKLGIPDWLLRYNPNGGDPLYFYIEFDVGTESVKKIKEKFQAYIHRAKEKPHDNIVVLFSLLDKSFHYRVDKNPIGPRKFSNLKQIFLDEEMTLPSNLKINIAYRNRAANIIKNMNLPVDKEQKIIPLLNHFRDVWGFQVEEILTEGFYRREVPEEHYAEQVIEIRDSEDQLKERIGIIVAEEGDIESFKRINGFYLANKNRLFISTVHRLIILYDDKLSMANDILGTDFDKSVFLANRVSLLEGDKKPFEEFISIFATKAIAYPFD